MAACTTNGQLSKECATLHQVFMNLISVEGHSAFEHFEPQDSDIIIAGYVKTGSTWLQQIVHQLRTGGDIEFDDILQVVPSVEVAYDAGHDLSQKQMAHPRCFKSNFSRCLKKGKYLVLFRNPYSVTYSHFKFMEGWLFQPGTVLLDEFMKTIWLQPAGSSLPYLRMYCDRIVSWWQHRHSPNVHVMFYEDLSEEFESGVRAIADFMGIQEEEKIQAALEMSTFKFMKEHWYKFSASPFKQEGTRLWACHKRQVSAITVRFALVQPQRGRLLYQQSCCMPLIRFGRKWSFLPQDKPAMGNSANAGRMKIESLRFSSCESVTKIVCMCMIYI